MKFFNVDSIRPRKVLENISTAYGYKGALYEIPPSIIDMRFNKIFKDSRYSDSRNNKRDPLASPKIKYLNVAIPWHQIFVGRNNYREVGIAYGFFSKKKYSIGDQLYAAFIPSSDPPDGRICLGTMSVNKTDEEFIRSYLETTCDDRHGFYGPDSIYDLEDWAAQTAEDPEFIFNTEWKYPVKLSKLFQNDKLKEAESNLPDPKISKERIV